MPTKDSKIKKFIEIDDFIVSMYEQDCHSYRYQDELRWSRFKVAMTIEGVFLSIAFTQLLIDLPLSHNWLRATFLAGLAIMIYLILSLARKDSEDASGHMNRVKYLEEKIVEATDDSTLQFDTKKIKLIPLLGPKMDGKTIMNSLICVISVINIALTIVWFFYPEKFNWIYNVDKP